MKPGGAIPFVLVIRDGKSRVSYRIDAEPEWTILDMLERLRSVQDGRAGRRFPAYRHSCHHGSCGTCGALVNGLETLMCLAKAKDLALPRPRVPGGPALEPERDPDGAVIVELEPLARMQVISGIAVYPGAFFGDLPGGASYLDRVEDAGRAPLPPDPVEAAPEKRPGEASWRPTGRVRFEACIECGLCVSSCPVVGPFIGPAALASLHRELQKRPENSAAILAEAAKPDGVGPCERHFACSRVCPQAVFPGKHIQLLRKRLAAGADAREGQL